MPVPIPGSKVGSDSHKVKFLTIFGRPKTGIFRGFRGVPGDPKALDMDSLAARSWWSMLGRSWLVGGSRNNASTLTCFPAAEVDGPPAWLVASGARPGTPEI